MGILGGLRRSRLALRVPAPVASDPRKTKSRPVLTSFPRYWRQCSSVPTRARAQVPRPATGPWRLGPGAVVLLVLRSGVASRSQSERAHVCRADNLLKARKSITNYPGYKLKMFGYNDNWNKYTNSPRDELTGHLQYLITANAARRRLALQI